MSKGVVGTMDTVGFITEPTIKIDRLIAYWFANRIDQCLILRNIHSYQYVIAKHQDDKKSEERLLADIENNLREYLLECFEGCSVSAWAKRENPGDKMFTLVLSGTVFQDGKEYDLAKSVLINGSTYELIDKGRGG
ncbi:putative virion structural protein [Klebsiella phage N1M2]|uniref:Putative virion structural protein n=1 Tax=Klebsiella phage N1M2 TaxID=2664939 RepID=A0A6B7ZES1_9CAUD|nr:putative virion structural protein [Klebsiella phage N1M2]QGH71905.1 putative virion structural protein [Klebsiella phage N1M2]